MAKQLEQLITMSSRKGLPNEPIVSVKLDKLVGSIPAQEPGRLSASVPNLQGMPAGMAPSTKQGMVMGFDVKAG